MLYVVGPKGQGGAAGQGPLLPLHSFLLEVENLGRRSMQAVADYNSAQIRKRADQQLPLIEEARWCLVSGGVYRHMDASKLDVAKATLKGMHGVSAPSVLVTFAYDDDNFRRAYEQWD